jgi:cell wall-associated NlpC family hydrolase
VGAPASVAARVVLFVLVVLAVDACVPGNAETMPAGATVLVGAAEPTEPTSEGLVNAVPAGSALRTTADVNLRGAPSASADVRLVIPRATTVMAIDGRPVDGWFGVRFGGVEGWTHGRFLALAAAAAEDGGVPTQDSARRDEIVERAKTGVGFSYWWGHGTWLLEGATTSTSGTCSGSCPSCTHSGARGADCSGFVAKVWQVPAGNAELQRDAHPYTTADFVEDGPEWSLITRGELLRADALVYRSGGSGHVLLYEAGDAWGSMWTYEARGCSYGIVHNLRSVTAAYRSIRRASP